MLERQHAMMEADAPELVRRCRTCEIHDLGTSLLLVASDAIVEAGSPIPGKGAICTALIAYWLKTLPACRFHDLEYVITADRVPAGCEPRAAQLSGRARVVRKATVLPIRCAVYGYLAERAWEEYRARGSVGGVNLPAGLRGNERLPEPIFAPCDKSAEPDSAALSLDDACDIAQEFMLGLGATPGAGRAVLLEARRRALDIYHQARSHAEPRGLLLAAATLRFGLWRNQLLLVGDVLTPNSACYWPAESYAIDRHVPSFDREPLTACLQRFELDRHAPPATLPAEVIAQTKARYEELQRRLTGPAPAH